MNQRSDGQDSPAMEVSSQVREHIEGIAGATRRRDAWTLVELVARVTGLSPELDRGMIGFGRYHYRYASGREGDAAAASFAPRAAATVVYLMDGVAAHSAALDRLGPHTTGVGCLYLKDLSLIDLDVLEGIIATSFAALRDGVSRR